MDYTKFPSTEYKYAGELDMAIIHLENNEPDKRKAEWKEWRECINSLRLKYNEIVRFKCYKQI